MTAPLFDVFVRTGFSAAGEGGGVPAIPRANDPILYTLGDGVASCLDAIVSGSAPFALFVDDAAAVSARGLHRVTQILAANPEISGLTLGAEAFGAVIGGSGAASRFDVAQSVSRITVVPAWFAVVNRDVLRRVGIDREARSLDFLLLDLAARMQTHGIPFLRIGAADVTMDPRRWARDLVDHAAAHHASDYARFRATWPDFVVPPQFRVELLGDFVEAPAIDATAGAAPSFSIVCPVFKPDFLAAMVDSVRHQTWRNWELLMLVDGPPPEALRRIRQVLEDHAADPRIYYDSQPNRGTGPTRRALAELATGDFVMSIDDDDVLAPDALETFASAIRHHPDAQVFRGGARLIGLVERELRPRPRLVIAGVSNDPFEVTQPWAIRRAALQKLGGFRWDTALRNAGEDTLLFDDIDRARLTTCIIDRPLYFRRLSTKNLSLDFRSEEGIAHLENVQRQTCPPGWHASDATGELVNGFQHSSTSYRERDTGLTVVTSTRFFQYRTLGSVQDAVIDLELTSVCNAVCTFCPRDVMPDKTQFLPLDVAQWLAGHLQKMSRPPQVVFCGIGESTLHPHLETIARLISATGTSVTMTTNGERMTVDRFERLSAAGIRGFNFSLNAATAETHRKLMRLRNFDQIVTTIQQVAEFQHRRRLGTRVYVSSVVCAENEPEVDAFVDFWRDKDVDGIWLHPLNNRAGLLTDTLRPFSMEAIAGRYRHEPKVTVDVFGSRSSHDGLCKIARSLIFISAEGNVRLCAMDYRRQTNYGNVRNGNLEEIHLNKLMAFASGETRHLCTGCDFAPEVPAWAPAEARTGGAIG